MREVQSGARREVPRKMQNEARQGVKSEARREVPRKIQSEARQGVKSEVRRGIRCDTGQAFRLAGQNFSGWQKNPRIWMTFLLALALCLFLSDEVIHLAREYETEMQILEPFIWTYGDAASVMLSSLLLVLLFADMPFVTQETPYRLVRTKRSVWLAGQLIYVVVTTIVYNVFLLVVQAVFAAPYAFTGNVWSRTAAMLGFGHGAKGGIPVSVKTMESAFPYECAAWVFLLMLCYSLLIVSVMLCLNLTVGHGAGVIGAFAVNLYGFLLSPEIFQKLFHLTENLQYQANVLCGWLSPLNHATFSMHNFGYDYLPQMGTSIGLFAGMILVLNIISGIRMRTYNFSFVQTDE